MAAKKCSTVARKAPKTPMKSVAPGCEDKNFDLVLRKLRAETKGLLPKGFSETIENDLTGSGKYAIPRRMALAYLERPWPEIVKQIQRDRGIAVSIAHVADVLRSTCQGYKVLLEWLTVAEVRMLAAVSTRKDSEQVMRDGKARTKEASTPAGKRKNRELLASIKVPSGYVTIQRLNDHGGAHG